MHISKLWRVLATLLLSVAMTFALTASAVHANATAQTAVSKSATKCLGAASFPLNDVCVTANYTVLDTQRVRISSVVACVDIMGPAFSAGVKPHVDIYSGGPKVWSRDGSRMVYTAIGFSQERCVWLWPWVTAKRGNVGVWLGVVAEVSTSNGPTTRVGPTWVGVSNFS